MPSEDLPPLPDGLIIFVKKDCPTCLEIEPVFDQLSKSFMPLTVYCQDDPDFPSGVTTVDYDSDLRVSWTHGIETVPTLIHVVGGREMTRTVGWERKSWEALTGIDNLGTDLPDWRPGCGSMSVDPSRVDQLEAKFGNSGVVSRRVEFASQEDEFEAMFDRGWSDGLPIIPPTE
jgi:thiol-disulfide isomerase/thioredoxin